jgi:hypothetical protein
MEVGLLSLIWSFPMIVALWQYAFRSRYIWSNAARGVKVGSSGGRRPPPEQEALGVADAQEIDWLGQLRSEGTTHVRPHLPRRRAEESGLATTTWQ